MMEDFKNWNPLREMTAEEREKQRKENKCIIQQAVEKDEGIADMVKKLDRLQSSQKNEFKGVKKEVKKGFAGLKKHTEEVAERTEAVVKATAKLSDERHEAIVKATAKLSDERHEADMKAMENRMSRKQDVAINMLRQDVLRAINGQSHSNSNQGKNCGRNFASSKQSRYVHNDAKRNQNYYRGNH